MNITSFVINLDRRPERLARFMAQPAAQALGVNRFRAIDAKAITPHPSWKLDSGGGFASLLSHHDVLYRADTSFDEEMKPILIFEDDALVPDWFPQELARFMEALPPNWDCCMLGGYPVKPPVHVSGPVYRIHQHNWIDCYLVHPRFISVIQRAYSHIIVNPAAHALHPTIKSVNGCWADTLHAYLQLSGCFNYYSPLNPWVGQDRSWSDNHDAPASPHTDSSHIEGWFTDEEGRAYLADALSLPANCVCVEVGVYMGRSLSWIAEAVQSKNGLIVAYDNWKQFPRKDRDQKGCEWFLWRAGLLKQEGICDFITLHNATSPKCSREHMDGSVDMVFIDATHDYESVRSDLIAWKPKLRKGGIICGHDYDPVGFPGVVRAVNEVLGPPHRLARHYWSITL